MLGGNCAEVAASSSPSALLCLPPVRLVIAATGYPFAGKIPAAASLCGQDVSKPTHALNENRYK